MNIPKLKKLAQKGVVYLLLPGDGVNVIKIDHSKYTSYRTTKSLCSCKDFFEKNSCKHLRLRKKTYEGTGVDAYTLASILENTGLSPPNGLDQIPDSTSSLQINITKNKPVIAFCHPRVTIYMGEEVLEKLNV